MLPINLLVRPIPFVEAREADLWTADPKSQRATLKILQKFSAIRVPTAGEIA